MIFDSHMHIGTIMNFDMTEDKLVKSMEKYNIDIAMVSNGEAAEYDHSGQRIPEKYTKSEVEANKITLDLAKRYKGKIFCQYWIKPATEGLTAEAEVLIANNLEYFRGIKMHPFHSTVDVTDSRVEPYLKLAQKHKLSFALHTAYDKYSDPELVYQAAKEYPNIDFIMVHMGLGTDNEKAIELISRLPNLYGDTTWVPKERVLDAIKKCGSEKVLFGTDNPIDGIDTYEKYLDMIELLKNKLSKSEFENVMYKNSKRIFNI